VVLNGETTPYREGERRAVNITVRGEDRGASERLRARKFHAPGKYRKGAIEGGNLIGSHLRLNRYRGQKTMHRRLRNSEGAFAGARREGERTLEGKIRTHFGGLTRLNPEPCGTMVRGLDRNGGQLLLTFSCGWVSHGACQRNADLIRTSPPLGNPSTRKSADVFTASGGKRRIKMPRRGKPPGGRA